MAVRFDAAADRLLRTTDLIDYNAAHTEMAWFFLVSDLNATTTLFSYDDNTASNLDSIRTQADGTQLAMRAQVGGAGTVVAGSQLTVGTWYHIAGVRESATSYKVYLNGVLDITNTTDVTGRTAATRMEIGGLRSTDTLPADARVSAIKVWSTALTLEQVQAGMHTIAPRSLTSLYAWYPCFPGSGERAADYSGNGRNWTESGTLTDEDPPPVSWGAPSRFIPRGAAGAQIALALAAASASSTPDTVALAVERALTLAAASGSTTPDTTVLAVARALSMAAASLSTTPDTTLLRLAIPLTLNAASLSSTPNTVALISLVALALNAASSSSTGDSTLAVARAIALVAASQSTTPNTVALAVARALTLNAASLSSTPDTLTLLSVVSFALNAASASSTPNTTVLAVMRALTLVAASLSTTGDITFGTLLAPWERSTFTPAAEDLSSLARRTYPFAAARESLTSEA